MSDRRRFLKRLTSLPLATVLAWPPQFPRDYRRSRPSWLTGERSRAPWPDLRAKPTAVSYWSMSGGGSFRSDDAGRIRGFPIGWPTLVRILVRGNPSGGREYLYRI
jgi:hypothetical protein